MQDDEIIGVKVKDLVRATGHNLSSYIHATKEKQWASRVEIAIGAAALRIVIEYGEQGLLNHCGGRGAKV